MGSANRCRAVEIRRNRLAGPSMSILSIFSRTNKTKANGKSALILRGGRRRGNRRPGKSENATSPNAEEDFHRTLWREHKRFERSQKQLLMLAISSEAPPETKDDEQLLQRVVNCVTESVRDTDLSGWYETNEVFVILFTELGSTDAPTATIAIRKKISACIQESFTTNQVGKVSLSFYPFPVHWEGNPSNGVKYAWDTRCDSDYSLAAGVSSVPRDHRFASRSACGGRDIANPAFRSGQNIAEDPPPAISGLAAIVEADVPASS